MLALHCCIFSIATITAAIAAAIVGAEARIALAPLCLLINKVIISEPERCRLEVAMLAIRIHHVTQVAHLVLHVRSIAPLTVVLVLTVLLAVPAAVFGACVMMLFPLSCGSLIGAHLPLR